MSDPVDLMKPWTIKAVASRTQATMIAAARRENLTVGQWLEKRVDEWEGQGSPEQRGAPSLAEFAALITAASTMPKLPREVRMLISDLARQARGLPRQIPGKTNGHLALKAPETDTETA